MLINQTLEKLDALGFLGMAGGRTHARLARQRARSNELEARLEAELEAERDALAPVSESAPEPSEAPPSPSAP